jgi:hypothetical protein
MLTSANSQLNVTFTARNGIVTKSDIALGKSKEEDWVANEKLIGRKLHEVEDWDTILGRPTLMKYHLPTHYLNDEQFHRYKRVVKQGPNPQLQSPRSHPLPKIGSA